jgi:hypothetical protein
LSIIDGGAYYEYDKNNQKRGGKTMRLTGGQIIAEYLIKEGMFRSLLT